MFTCISLSLPPLSPPLSQPLSSEVRRLERELSHQHVAMSRARTQLVESEGSNKQLSLRVSHLEDQLVKVSWSCMRSEGAAAAAVVTSTMVT